MNFDPNQINKEELKQKAKDHMVNKVLVVDDLDKQIWELVTAVPRLSKQWAVGCALLNFIIPGTGTIVAACKASGAVSKA